MIPVKFILQVLALYFLIFSKRYLLLGLLLCSLCLSSWAQLNGAYTINSALPAGQRNFDSFALAIQTLESQGVSGPVSFEVMSGTYEEQLSIGPINNASQTNHVRFHSQNGDPSDVILRHTATQANSNYVLKLDGADYLTFEGISFQALSTDFARVLELKNGADENTFNSCRFVGQTPGTNASDDKFAVVYCREFSSSNSSHGNVFRQNVFESGGWGMYCRNDGGSDKIREFQVLENQFLNQAWTALYFFSTEGNQIRGNAIRSASIGNGMFIRSVNEVDWFIQKNLLVLSNPSRMVTGMNLGIGKSGFYSDVSNNIIHIDNSGGVAGARGMTLGFCRDLSISYNTIEINPGSSVPAQSTVVYENTSSINSWGPVHIQNNIFSNLGNGYVLGFRLDPSAGVGSMNYNMYHTQGSHLVDWAGTHLLDLAALRTQSSKDAQSVERNPQLISSHGELRVDASVFGEMDFVATPLTGTTDDFYGALRDPNIPRKGASEHDALGNIFPVEWVYVRGRKANDQMHLSWATSQEINHDHFLVQRRNATLMWQDLARITSPVSEGQIRAYEWVDQHPLRGSSIYRIVQQDYDGKRSFSRQIEINFSSSDELKIFPNPVRDFIWIEESVNMEELVLIDIRGKELMRKRLLSDKRVGLSLKDIAPGMYLIQVFDQRKAKIGQRRIMKH